MGNEARRASTASRKVIPPVEKVHADELQVVWHFDVGFLAFFIIAFTHIFYRDTCAIHRCESSARFFIVAR